MASPYPQQQQQYNAGAGAPGGYFHREGVAPVAAPTQKRSFFEFLSSKWPRMFFGVSVLQAILCLAFEAYVFAVFQSNLKPAARNKANESQFKIIPTFLALFIFAFLYELILVWDALRAKNTIQIIGICISNLAILVYCVLQTDQISEAVTILVMNGEALENRELWGVIRPFLIAIPIVIAIATVAMAYCAWKLYQVFAWDILKQIGADYRMKKRFLHYQIYIALLKFDFFFFLGFTIQFLIIVSDIDTVEMALTSVAIPVTMIILLSAAFFTRREIKFGMITTILLYLGALAYFFFKLVRIYQPGFRDHYQGVKKSLTAFSVVTIILLIMTIINAFVCMNNFNTGLKPHILSRHFDEEKHPDAHSIGLSDVSTKPAMPSRMTID